jgi:hypothetical protein
LAGLNHAQIGNIAAAQLGREFTDRERDAVIFAIANAITENNRRLTSELDEIRSALVSHRHGR